MSLMGQECWFCDRKITSIWHAFVCPIREWFGGTPTTTVWAASTAPGKAAMLITLSVMTLGIPAVIYANIAIWTNH